MTRPIEESDKDGQARLVTDGTNTSYGFWRVPDGWRQGLPEYDGMAPLGFEPTHVLEEAA